MMTRELSSLQNSRTWNWVPDGFQIPPWLLTLVSLLSMLTEMETPSQLLEDLSMDSTWKPIISTLTQEATNLSFLKFMEELFWEELFRSELQDQGALKRSQLRWSESQFLQELLHRESKFNKRNSLRIIREDFQRIHKHGSKLLLRSLRSCLQLSPRSICKLRKLLKK